MSNKLVLNAVSKAFGTNQVLNEVSLSINAGLAQDFNWPNKADEGNVFLQ